VRGAAAFDGLGNFVGNRGGSAECEALIDPAISINQQRFQQLYGDQCIVAFAGLCPDANTLVTVELSEGLSLATQPSPIPAPPALVLFASAFGFFWCSRRAHARAAIHVLISAHAKKQR